MPLSAAYFPSSQSAATRKRLLEILNITTLKIIDKNLHANKPQHKQILIVIRKHVIFFKLQTDHDSNIRQEIRKLKDYLKLQAKIQT